MADPLAIYLTDHLAGSVAALELREELGAMHRARPLESIVLGLQGKVSLYRVLTVLAAHDPRLAVAEYSDLEARTLRLAGAAALAVSEREPWVWVAEGC